MEKSSQKIAFLLTRGETGSNLNASNAGLIIIVLIMQTTPIHVKKERLIIKNFTMRNILGNVKMGIKKIEMKEELKLAL